MKLQHISETVKLPLKKPILGGDDLITLYRKYEELAAEIFNISHDIKNAPKSNQYSISDWQELLDTKKKKQTDIKNKITAEAQPIIKVLTTQCSDYFDIIKRSINIPLRGRKSKVGGRIFQGVSVKNRNAKDSTNSATAIFNQALTMLGIHANRANSIFVTGSKDQALDYADWSYADLYVIFPMNTATFSWCRAKNKSDMVLSASDFNGIIKYRDVKDILLTQERRDVQKQFDTVHEKIYQEHYSAAATKKYQPLIDRLSEMLTIIDDVLAGRNTNDEFDREVKYVKRYFPTSILARDPERFRPHIEIDLVKFQKKFDVTDKDFAAALQNKGEIAVHGKYLAIQYQIWQMLTQDMKVINA